MLEDIRLVQRVPKTVRGALRLYSFLSYPSNSVKNRLVPTAETDSSTGPPGLSFTEFSYQLLQAHDFSVLHNAPWDCSIQLGGSDQMGNIMAGVDLIRRQRFASATASSTGSSPESVESENTIAESPAYGLTLPLLTTSSGAKFGKSAGNAIWLSNSLLGDYDFYQFFLRTTDADVSRYLRALTLLPLPHIEEVLTQHGQDPARRIAQRALADSVTEMVRGETGLERAKVASKLLFEKGGDEKMQLKVSEIVHAFEGDSRLVRVQRDQAMGADIVKLAALVGVCKSKGSSGCSLST